MISLSRILLVILAVTFIIPAKAQRRPTVSPFEHVEPAFWWTGMKKAEVQVLFHGTTLDFSTLQASVSYPGVTIKDQTRVENNHFLFVTLQIGANAAPGKFPISFTGGKKKLDYTYELRAKSTSTNRIRGFNASDVIYLIMPDRFANGDPKNDSLPGSLEGVHREKGGSRHGGDLKGISDHLDYIRDLGVTALWLNPVLENNQKHSSYHGYAVTDLYNVDARFGGNEAYLQFIDRSHQMGIKVIQDMIMNHIGNEHWLVKDPPQKDWVHQFPEFTRSNYRGTVISDPYQSKRDAMLMNDGWFDTTMPDVNQKNPLFAIYLIQNTLWWIEYAGLDGIRMDTYPYPDKEFMKEYMRRVLEEYPAFNVVGEAWLNNVTNTAYWQKDMANKDGYQSYLPSVTDFPFCFAVPQALNEPPGWDSGLARLYNILTQDFIYPDPNGNLTFLDNHDLTRYYLTVGRDIRKFKMGLAFLLTTRGVPQLYYGTELLMDGDGGHHPNIRKDFPGGWAGDARNAFTKEGRSPQENEAYDFLRTLLNWRKTASVVHTGKLTHYIPEDNVYVYFRSNNDKTVMVVMNGNDGEKKLNTTRFAENIGKFSSGKDVITGASVSLSDLQVPGKTALVLELAN